MKKGTLKNFKLYAVTSLGPSGAAGLPAKVEAVCRGGADIVQLRAKGLADGALAALAQQLRKVTQRLGKLFIVNDRVDIALGVAADGVHLGQEDLPVSMARELARQTGRQLIIGKSTHTLDQALAAEQEGADYIGVGPVFATPTKPGRPAAGLSFVRQSAQKLRIPFVAIGGIDADNLRQVIDAGAQSVACVRALFDADDPFQAARKIREQLEASPSDCASH